MDGEFEEQNYEIKEEKLIIGNNPWTVSSLYQFQYFCCPSCIFRVDSKQDFVDHTTTIHPESLEHLLKIEDDSLQGDISKVCAIVSRVPNIWFLSPLVLSKRENLALLSSYIF